MFVRTSLAVLAAIAVTTTVLFNTEVSLKREGD